MNSVVNYGGDMSKLAHSSKNEMQCANDKRHYLERTRVVAAANILVLFIETMQ